VISGDAVIHEQTYPHPPERVWRALVDPDELSQWLMPSAFIPTVGYAFSTWWAPLGPIDVTVIDVECPRRLIWLWRGSFGQALVTFTLRPEKEGTRLRLEHTRIDPDDTAETAYRPAASIGIRSGHTLMRP
jgi:uncharacterized protein YndB with AHSA1/START domain